MKRLALLILAVLLATTVGAFATGTLTVPINFGSYTAGVHNLSDFDTNVAAVVNYINARELTLDVAANRPAAGTHGRYFFSTDTKVFNCDDGSAWQQCATQAVYTEQLTGLSTGGAASTQVVVQAGAAASDDSTITSRVLMTLASATQGNTAGSWVVGNFQNKLDAGALGANQFWHIYVIQRTDTGNVDILFSQSATAPTMPTNYTKKRRVGYFLTNGASAPVAWTQYGDEFMYADPSAFGLSVVDVNPGTSAKIATASCPNGINPQAILQINMDVPSTTQQVIYISSADASDVAPTLGAGSLGSLTAGTATAIGLFTAGAQVRVWTDTNRQFRYRLNSSGATTVVRVQTIGCVYPRRP